MTVLPVGGSPTPFLLVAQHAYIRSGRRGRSPAHCRLQVDVVSGEHVSARQSHLIPPTGLFRSPSSLSGLEVVVGDLVVTADAMGQKPFPPGANQDR